MNFNIYQEPVKNALIYLLALKTSSLKEERDAILSSLNQLKNLEDAIYNYLVTSECHLEFYLVKREFWDSWCSNVSFHGNKSNLAIR